MTEQFAMREPTSGAVNNMTHVRTGVVLFLILCLTSSTSFLVTAGPIRVKNGDWIRYDSINIGEIPFSSGTAWSKVEFLNVSEPIATIRVTMNRTDGTKQTRTTKINVASDSQSSSGFSGFVIPTDLNVGDYFHVGGWGNVTVTGETEKTYAGTRRTVVYAPYSESREADDPEIETISYWDKHTGIFLEETVTAAKYTMSFKATQTNMWSPQVFGILDWQILVLVAIPFACVIVVTVLILDRRRKQITSPLQNESESSSSQSPSQELFTLRKRSLKHVLWWEIRCLNLK
jgi:hypothetical protein